MLFYVLAPLFFALLADAAHVDFVLSVHEAHEVLHLGPQELSLLVRCGEGKCILDEASGHELVLDDLDLAYKLDVTSPAGHALVDLFLLVDDAELLNEVLLVWTWHILKVAAVVELFVIDEDLCLRESRL